MPMCTRSPPGEAGWRLGEWIPVPYLDEAAAEKLFRHKVVALFRRRGRLSQVRVELLLSWRRSGFSIHNWVWVHPGEGREFKALVRYMMRPLHRTTFQGPRQGHSPGTRESNLLSLHRCLRIAPTTSTHTGTPAMRSGRRTPGGSASRRLIFSA
jgi:hypothetical protein